MKKRVLIYVQHFIGSGHLKRAMHLADKFSNDGYDVLLVSGGNKVSGFELKAARLEQLPPLSVKNADFSLLLDEANAPVSEEYLSLRRQQLLKVVGSFIPDVVITEAIPFGRRSLRKEWLSLLQYVRSWDVQPVVLCSVRDVLQPKRKTQRNMEVLQWLEQYYDAVLVHGDSAFIRLEASFLRAKDIAVPVHYTGYILADKENSPDYQCKRSVNRSGIVVSVGGGVTGLPLLSLALQVSQSIDNEAWTVFVPHAISEVEFKQLVSQAAAHVTVIRNTPQLLIKLATAKLSLSYCGYNTAMDIMRSRVPAIFVAYDENNEQEQAIRAQQLQAHGVGKMLSHTSLSPQLLHDAVLDMLNKKSINYKSPNLNGLENTIELVNSYVKKHAI